MGRLCSLLQSHLMWNFFLTFSLASQPNTWHEKIRWDAGKSGHFIPQESLPAVSLLLHLLPLQTSLASSRNFWIFFLRSFFERKIEEDCLVGLTNNSQHFLSVVLFSITKFLTSQCNVKICWKHVCWHVRTHHQHRNIRLWCCFHAEYPGKCRNSVAKLCCPSAKIPILYVNIVLLAVPHQSSCGFVVIHFVPRRRSPLRG